MIRSDQHREDDALAEKIRYRRRALQWLDDTPVVLEVFGRWGTIHRACYRSIADGVIFERDHERAALLSAMRPEWGVYRGKPLSLLRAGIGKEWPINVVDVNASGEPWPYIEAFFESDRPWPNRLIVVVHDGVRPMLMRHRAWQVRSLNDLVDRYGNRQVAEHYTAMCRELLAMHAARAGYTVTQWVAGYSGDRNRNTHYLAALDRRSPMTRADQNGSVSDVIPQP